MAAAGTDRRRDASQSQERSGGEHKLGRNRGQSLNLSALASDSTHSSQKNKGRAGESRHRLELSRDKALEDSPSCQPAAECGDHHDHCEIINGNLSSPSSGPYVHTMLDFC